MYNISLNAVFEGSEDFREIEVLKNAEDGDFFMCSGSERIQHGAVSATGRLEAGDTIYFRINGVASGSYKAPRGPKTPLTFTVIKLANL